MQCIYCGREVKPGEKCPGCAALAGSIGKWVITFSERLNEYEVAVIQERWRMFWDNHDASLMVLDSGAQIARLDEGGSGK